MSNHSAIQCDECLERTEFTRSRPNGWRPMYVEQFAFDLCPDCFLRLLRTLPRVRSLLVGQGVLDKDHS